MNIDGSFTGILKGGDYIFYRTFEL